MEAQTKAKRVASFVFDSVKTMLMFVGLWTVLDFCQAHWPHATKVGLVVGAVVGVVGFLWLTVVMPFLVGLREGKAKSGE